MTINIWVVTACWPLCPLSGRRALCMVRHSIPDGGGGVWTAHTLRRTSCRLSPHGVNREESPSWAGGSVDTLPAPFLFSGMGSWHTDNGIAALRALSFVLVTKCSPLLAQDAPQAGVCTETMMA